uniref:Putative RNA polymerase sigma factor n=1 Tax=mine drainage metagenome TaxID=410659 RepID=E6PVB1_9ZZZZ
MPDLEKLLAYTALADQQAFAALYEATRRRGWAICLRLLRDPAQAEDAMQEAYVKIWHQAASYRPTQGAAEVWLATVVRNTCLDKLRAKGREPVESLDAMEVPLDPADTAPGPEQLLERSMSHGSLERCFDELKPQQRELLTHSYVMGMSHGELAKLSGMALGTVKTIIRRAILALRACLGEGAGS